MLHIVVQAIAQELYLDCRSALKWLGPAFIAAGKDPLQKPEVESLLNDLR